MLICLLHLRLFACLSLCLIVCFYVCPYLCPYLYVCLFVSLSTIPYAAKYAFINYWRNGRTNDGQVHRRRLWGSPGASPPIFWKCPYTYPLLPHFAPPPKKKKIWVWPTNIFDKWPGIRMRERESCRFCSRQPHWRFIMSPYNDSHCLALVCHQLMPCVYNPDAIEVKVDCN